MTDELPDWCVPGAAVVEFTEHRHREGGHVKYTTIERVLKRDVVLANGSRYNRTLRKRNGSWDPDTRVLHKDDPKVLKAIRANQQARHRSEIETQWIEVRRQWKVEEMAKLRDLLTIYIEKEQR